MRSFGRILPAVFVLSFFTAGGVRAQEDFRSLDAGRPFRTGDAYPKKYLEWEVQVGSSSGWAEGGAGVSAPLALEVGLLPNFELGFDIEPGYENLEGEAGEWGVEEVGLHALFNFNQESPRLPGLAVQVDVEAPSGGELSREEWAVAGLVAATRSFANRARVHANLGFSAQDGVDGDDFWIGGVAVDVPLGLTSRLVGANVYVEVPEGRGSTRSWAELGGRIQVSNTSVVDLGLATRLDRWDDGEANVELVVGISRVFGVRPLTPRPSYPDPAIR